MVSTKTGKTETVILDILSKLGKDIAGLSVREINLQLRALDIKVKESEILDILNRLVEEGKVDRRYRPGKRLETCFNIPDQGIYQKSIFDRQISRDEIEREERNAFDLWQTDESERERIAVSVMEEIARTHALEERFAKSVHDTASDLAEENPVNLILEMAEWAVNDLNGLAKTIKKASGGQLTEIQRLTKELGFRCSKAEKFFQRLFRLDGPIGTFPGIMEIPTVKQMLQGRQAKFDEKSAENRLRERIYGEKVIEIFDVPPNPHRAAAGTDASVGDIMVEHARGSFIPPIPASLFASAAAMRVVDKQNSLNYWDYDLDPRELRKYGDLDAAIEGLLISPHLRREVITDFRHLRSAAMELRQYVEELRVVLQNSKWHPISGVPEIQHPPPVTLLIRDGRIFPLVHRLDDYDGASAPDDILYGEIVRKEIRTFRDVFHNTAGKGYGGPIYSGAVKSPEFSWLAMIVFWYLYKKTRAQELADAFYRPPLNDQAVTHLLFWGLAEKKVSELSNERLAFATFRVLRRFSDIAFFPHPQPLCDDQGNVVNIVDENEINHWQDYFRQHITEANQGYDRHKRSIPALTTIDEYEPFIDLCHRAGVVMFYAAPLRIYRATVCDRSHFLMPRWEVAVELIHNNLSEKVNGGVKGLLAWITDPEGLAADETHAVGGFEEVAEGLPLFIPDVVLEAHKAIYYGRDRFASDLHDELQKMISEKRRIGHSIR